MSFLKCSSKVIYGCIIAGFITSSSISYAQNNRIAERQVRYDRALVLDGTHLVVDLNKDGKLSRLTETVELIGLTAYPYYTDLELTAPGSFVTLQIIPKLRSLSKYLQLPTESIKQRGQFGHDSLQRYLKPLPYFYLDFVENFSRTREHNIAVYLVDPFGQDIGAKLLADDVVYLTQNHISHPEQHRYTKIRAFRRYGDLAPEANSEVLFSDEESD